MLSIFADTLSKAIRDYRQLLRRHTVSQTERVNKLIEFNIKNPNYEDEVALYYSGYAIVRDIEQHLDDTDEESYYAYSGTRNFARYLKKFLSNYSVQGNAVIHRAQEASRALIEAIQLLGLPAERLTGDILEKIKRCHITIAHYGTEDQCEIYRANLERYYRERGAFFGPLLKQFEEQLDSVEKISEAA